MADPDIAHADIAGWVLGALDPDESERFQAHLETCDERQREVRNSARPQRCSGCCAGCGPGHRPRAARRPAGPDASPDRAGGPQIPVAPGERPDARRALLLHRHAAEALAG